MMKVERKRKTLQEMEDEELWVAMLVPHLKYDREDVLKEAFCRFKAGKLTLQTLQSYAIWAGRAVLDIDRIERSLNGFSLLHDTPEIREYFFNLVSAICNVGIGFFSGTKDAQNVHFMNVVKHIAYVKTYSLREDDLTEDIDALQKANYAQQEVITNLGMLLVVNKTCGGVVGHLKDVANAFLDISIIVPCEVRMTVEKYRSDIDSIRMPTQVTDQKTYCAIL